MLSQIITDYDHDLNDFHRFGFVWLGLGLGLGLG